MIEHEVVETGKVIAPCQQDGKNADCQYPPFMPAIEIKHPEQKEEANYGT
jgi:hypothetical protein